MLRLIAPTVIYLQLTNSCNDKCLGCEIQSNCHSGKSLSAKEWLLVLDKILPYVHEIRIMGGEPTLFDGLFEILDFIEKRRVLFSLFSNGRWPQPEDVVERLRYYTCLDQIMITIFGASSSSHEYYTQIPGSFREVKENIFRAVTGNLRINIGCVVHRNNIDEIKEIYRIAENAGAESLVLRRFHCRAIHKIRNNEFSCGRDDFEAMLKGSGSPGVKSLPLRLDYCFPKCFHKDKASGCFAGISVAGIDPQGNVHPCPGDPQHLGNIVRDSLEGIWKKGRLFQWRKKRPPIKCRSCAYLEQCFGGCRIMGGIDPFICGPPTGKDEMSRSGQNIKKLDADLSPVCNFLVRKESFGYSLIRSHLVIPASGKFVDIIDRLDGRHTLGQIQSRFGEDTISFLYKLYERDFIFLV